MDYMKRFLFNKLDIQYSENKRKKICYSSVGKSGGQKQIIENGNELFQQLKIRHEDVDFQQLDFSDIDVIEQVNTT